MPVIFTTDPDTLATTGLLSSDVSGAATSRACVGVSGSRTSGSPRRSIASRRLPYTERTLSGTARSTACTSADCRTWLATCGNGELASGVATIQATSRTAAADSTAPATESTILAGSQVTRLRTARPTAPASTCPSRAPARTTTSAANTRVTLEPLIRSATGPDSCAPSTAPPKNPRNEAAETIRPWRNPEKANSSARRMRMRSTIDTCGRLLSADRHGAGLPELDVEAALEGVLAGCGHGELDGRAVTWRQQRDLGGDRLGALAGPEPEVVGQLRGRVGHGQPDLAGCDGEVVGREDVVVLGLQGDLLDAVGIRGDLAQVAVRRRRRGRGAAAVPAAAAGQCT